MSPVPPPLTPPLAASHLRHQHPDPAMPLPLVFLVAVLVSAAVAALLCSALFGAVLLLVRHATRTSQTTRPSPHEDDLATKHVFTPRATPPFPSPLQTNLVYNPPPHPTTPSTTAAAAAAQLLPDRLSVLSRAPRSPFHSPTPSLGAAGTMLHCCAHCGAPRCDPGSCGEYGTFGRRVAVFGHFSGSLASIADLAPPSPALSSPRELSRDPSLASLAHADHVAAAVATAAARRARRDAQQELVMAQLYLG